MASVLVCEGSAQLRSVLDRRAAAVPGVDRVATAGTATEALARIRSLGIDGRTGGGAADTVERDGEPPATGPDIVLLDAHLPPVGATPVLRRLLTNHPRAVVFVLGTGEDAEAVADAMAYGARGVLHKNLSHEELAAALAHVLSEPEQLPVRSQPDGPRIVLSVREMQVLRGMCQGKSNSEIGQDLFLSEDTVKTHARRLYRKLGVNDRAHAVASGFRLGLVS